MQDKIQEIMGLVQEYADYERQCVRREIESKLRELVREPLAVQYPENYENQFARIAYDAGWRSAERAHNITNTQN